MNDEQMSATARYKSAKVSHDYAGEVTFLEMLMLRFIGDENKLTEIRRARENALRGIRT